MFESVNIIITLIISVVTGVGGFLLNVYKTKKQSDAQDKSVKDKIIESIDKENDRLRDVNNYLEDENTKLYKDLHECLNEKNDLISRND